MESKNEGMSKNSMMYMSIGVLVVFVGLVIFLYTWVSKKNKGNVVFPAGINYTGNEESGEQATEPKKPVYDYTAYVAASDWATFNSPQKQFSFQHPKEMVALVFPGDTTDKVTFDVTEVDPKLNIMALVENISERDAKLVGKPEEFAKGYWKFFGGLKGLSSIEPYENKAGLKGFKAIYLNKANETTGENYFFVIPGQDDKVIHFSNIFPKNEDANGVFMRMLDTVSTKIVVVPTVAAQ